MYIDLGALIPNIKLPWPIDVGRCVGTCIEKYHTGEKRYRGHMHHIRSKYRYTVVLD